MGDRDEARLMRVAELMQRDLTLIPSEESVQSAAQAIADLDGRFILVGSDDRLLGIVTIRDILIRVVAAGRDPTATPVSQVMSSSLFTCREEEAAESVSQRMAEHRIEQMPVVDTGGRVVGLVSRRAAETLQPVASIR